MRPLAAIGLLALSAWASAQAPAAGEKALQQTQAQAAEAAEAAREALQASRQRFKDLERLKKEVRYIAEDLDRDIVGPRRQPDDYARLLTARIQDLRSRGNLDAKLGPALDRLEALYEKLPRLDGMKFYPRGYVKNLSEELRWIAENAGTEEEFLRLLDENLRIPDDPEADPATPGVLAFLPKDVPLDKFKKLNPIKVFLMKHRLKRGTPAPPVTTAADVLAGRHNVQVYVELTGKATHHDYTHVDGDFTFDFGGLHLEITPEWRLIHRGFPKPKTGDTVRVRGWTYYDVFHRTEEEYHPDDPVIGINRISLWEIHPVMEISILSSASGPGGEPDSP